MIARPARREVLKNSLPFLVAVFLFSGNVAHADGGPFDYRFAFWGGAYIAEVDTSMRWDSDILPGTEIGFESTLGMDDNDASFNGEFEWRFFNRHALDLRYFKLSRNGVNDTPISLVINGNVIPIDAEVSSFFDVEVIALKYAFTFIKRDNLMMDVGLGLSIQDLSFGIAAREVDIAEAADVTAPLPTITLGLDWAITPKWIASLDLGWFEVKLDNVKGKITEFRGGVTWKPFENVGFNLAYNFFDVDATVTSPEGNFEGSVNYDFKGPMIGAVVTF
jgi:hypothetical protein